MEDVRIPLNMRNYLFLLCICLLIVQGTALPSPDDWRSTARDQYSTLSKEEVDPYITPLIEYNLSKGLMVILVDKNGYTIIPYGSISTQVPDIPENKTLFEIGSLSKVMTGLLMADAELKGEYNLSAPVNTWLPPEYILPDYEGIAITGIDLATHRSGLPSSPDSFSEYDPIASYADQIEQSMQHFQTMTAEETYNWITESSMLAPPGYQYLYSNLGAAIAGDSVSRATGIPYPELLRERILNPLNMSDSGASWSIDDLSRHTHGYRAYEYPTDEAHLIRFNDFWTATGGIHSSPEDMAIFLAAQLGLVETDLADAINLTQKPYGIITEGPPRMEQGIFWDILHNRDGTIILKKAGETNAHQAAIAFNLDLGTGVVILSNTAHIQGIHVEAEAIALLERIQVKENFEE